MAKLDRQLEQYFKKFNIKKTAEKKEEDNSKGEAPITSDNAADTTTMSESSDNLVSEIDKVLSSIEELSNDEDSKTEDAKEAADKAPEADVESVDSVDKVEVEDEVKKEDDKETADAKASGEESETKKEAAMKEDMSEKDSKKEECSPETCSEEEMKEYSKKEKSSEEDKKKEAALKLLVAETFKEAKLDFAKRASLLKEAANLKKLLPLLAGMGVGGAGTLAATQIDPEQLSDLVSGAGESIQDFIGQGSDLAELGLGRAKDSAELGLGTAKDMAEYAGGEIADTAGNSWEDFKAWAQKAAEEDMLQNDNSQDMWKGSAYESAFNKLDSETAKLNKERKAKKPAMKANKTSPDAKKEKVAWDELNKSKGNSITTKRTIK